MKKYYLFGNSPARHPEPWRRPREGSPIIENRLNIGDPSSHKAGLGMTWRVTLFVFLIFLSSLIQAQINKYTLKNGLTVILKPVSRAPIVISMIWYKVGSADEPGGLTGISHALEHMMFKGTPQISAKQFFQYLAQNGGQYNAFTDQDYTVYFEKTVNTALPMILKLEADRMRHLTLSATDFKKEIEVVKEERRLRIDNDPKALAIERFMATAHLMPPYQHPVIGWMSDLHHLHVHDLRTWYHRYYAPNNATLVIAGDFDIHQVKHQILQTFNLSKRKISPIKYPQIEPKALGQKRVTISIPHAQQPMILLGYTAPSIKSVQDLQDAYTLEVIAGILDAGDSGVLTQSLIKKQHLAVTVNVSYNLYTRYQNQFLLLGIPAPPHTLKELKQGFMREIEKLKQSLVSASLLQRVQTQCIAAKTFEQDALFNQALELGLLASLDLPLSLAEDYAKHIRMVTAEDIQRVAQHIFCKRCLTEAKLIPRTGVHHAL